MHLAFVDITYGYTADRPDSAAPVGGTTSAVCFTARELVKAGVKCSFFNKIEAPAEACGIPSLPLSALAQAVNNPDYTAFIFCGRWIPDMVRLIRANTKVQLIAWMHESSFNDKLVTALPEFDAVSYVSAWQQRINQPLAYPHWRQVVIRGAMNPHFAALFDVDEPILAVKTRPPILLYAGTAPRGVFHLPPILDELRKLRQDFTVEIYCNTNPSGSAEQDAQYITWLRGLLKVTHVGMVGQPQLAQAMKRAAFLISPNTWPETSCISMIEGMAAGLSVITTNRAVLPETAAGFARHIAVDTPDDPVRFDMPVPAAAFANAINLAMDEWINLPQKIEQKLRAQINYCLAHYQWQQRPAYWIEFLKG